jgi:hypothetical protein
MNLNPTTVAAITAAGIVVYMLLKEEAAAVVGAVGDAIDPTNPNNIFHSGVNAVGENISGQKGWSLGGWIYDITHEQEQ